MKSGFIMERSYEKISSTAKLVAYLRGFTDIPYAKEIAVESGAKKTFQELAGESAESMVRLVPRWEARYKVTDRILAEHDVTQVLEIAAGLSPRGLAMTTNPDIVYVVTDLPQILEEEKTIAEKILAKSDNRRPNLHFQAANALEMESLWRAATVFESDRPVGIITEGLFPYFNRGEQETLAGNIHELLGKYDGLWITTEVHTKQYWQKLSKINEKLVRERLSAISSSTGTNIEGNVFADQNDLEQFFGKAGFKIKEYSHSEVLEDLSSVKLLNLDREEKLRMTRFLKIFKTLVLTPNTARAADVRNRRTTP
jgi:O-methyltransferase involved in polyketide biosynthesis